jgi:hypothetical protein
MCAFSAFSLSSGKGNKEKEAELEKDGNSSEDPQKTTGAYARVTIGGGLALSNMEVNMSEGSNFYGSFEGGAGFGGNVYLDYMFPIRLSLGAEIGLHGSSFISEFPNRTTMEDTVAAIPLLLRVAYHFDLKPKLDLYLMGKIGYVPSIWEGDLKNSFEVHGDTADNPGGIGFGFDLGAAWYFTGKVGAFAELGFDRYVLSTEVFYSGVKPATVDMPFSRFLTAGICFKL